MLPTEDPVTYVFSHPQAKAILYRLEDAGATPYEKLRGLLGLDSMSFHRVTRRLAQFNLIWLRAPKGARWKGTKIRLVAELSPDRAGMVKLFHELDKVVQRHPDVPSATKDLLSVA